MKTNELLKKLVLILAVVATTPGVHAMQRGGVAKNYGWYASLTQEEKNQKLFDTFWADRADSTAALLAVGAQVNFQAETGATPLHHAALNGFKDVAQVLLNAGAAVNCLDGSLNTPLHIAVIFSRTNVVTMLLDVEGVKVNAQNAWHQTPLHYVAINGKIDIVSLLLKCGADVNVRDFLDRTPADSARANGHEKCARLIEDWIQHCLALRSRMIPRN